MFASSLAAKEKTARKDNDITPLPMSSCAGCIAGVHVGGVILGRVDGEVRALRPRAASEAMRCTRAHKLLDMPSELSKLSELNDRRPASGSLVFRAYAESLGR